MCSSSSSSSNSSSTSSSKFCEVIIHFRLLQKVCATVQLVFFCLNIATQGWMDLLEADSMPKSFVKIMRLFL
jgi:hypothetical protein